MFKNYLKIAWRNITKQKFYTAINILGLTIGLTCCFMIFMYVRFELSYDNFHKFGDQLYRVVVDVKTPTETIHSSATSGPMGPTLKADFPEVLSQTRVNLTQLLIGVGDMKYKEDKVLFADSSFFNLFSFPLVKGNANEVLRAPFTVVLSENLARKYFGNADPMGKTLVFDGHYFSATVTGIMKDVPKNSSLPFNMVVSMATEQKLENNSIDQNWGSFGVRAYVMLPVGYDPRQLEKKLPAFMERHVGANMKAWKMSYSLFLEPLADVYMRSSRGAEIKGSLTNVYIFSIVAIFILLIAVINFVNLATARATERAREVGVRKAIGAYKEQLTWQFLAEAVMLSMIAYLLAMVLSQLLLPAFNLLAGKDVQRSILEHYDFLWFVPLAFLVGLMAGIYPALVLASYKPVVVLKGAFSNSNKGLLLRRGLVVFQFMITIVLIAGVLIVYHQLRFLQAQELGFKKEQMVVLTTGGMEGDKWIAMKQQLLQQPGVNGATFSSSVPSTIENSAYTNLEAKNGEMQASNINLYYVDYDYVKNYGMKIIAGRDFSANMGTDSIAAMLVNEATAKSIGYKNPAEIIGKKFSQWGREGRVIGVIKNFNYQSLRSEVSPLTLRIEPSGFQKVTVSVNTHNLRSTLTDLETIYNRFVPEGQFEYYFLDDAFNRQYEGDYNFGRLVLTFALLAILLATLGLLGLVSYMVIQRTKEIGIRKVLGASVGNILYLLSKDFLRLVTIALLVATPLTWYIMYKWLEDFAYRAPIEWWMFVVSGGMAMVIALLTVSLQTMKAALANPVKSLRTE